MKAELLIGILGAALLLGLVLAQAAAVLPGCGIRLGSLGRLDFCVSRAVAGPSPALVAELDRSAALEERVRGLERRLAGLPACRPPPAATASPNQNRIPIDWMPSAGRSRDMSLLEGCWSLASQYTIRNQSTGVVSSVDTWEMCFDTEGRGQQHLVFEGGAVCSGALTAAFREDGQLEINDEANVQCSDNSYIYRRIITCGLEPNGEAGCRDYQPETGGGSDVRITRRVSR